MKKEHLSTTLAWIGYRERFLLQSQQLSFDYPIIKQFESGRYISKTDEHSPLFYTHQVGRQLLPSSPRRLCVATEYSQTWVHGQRQRTRGWDLHVRLWLS